MSYPVICFYDDFRGDRVFLVPHKEILLSFSKDNFDDEEKNLKFGTQAFLSCLTSNEVYNDGHFAIHINKNLDATQAVMDFEKKIMMEPHQYDAYIISPQGEEKEIIDEKDLSVLEEMVEINLSEKVKKPTLN